MIGHLLIRQDEQPRLVGRIVETEAYSEQDPSSHSFRGKTARNASMFGPPGHAYVYLIYGYHYCLNVVTGPVGRADAVLIRALEPLEGLEKMRLRRGIENVRLRRSLGNDRLLLAGPGRLCQAFGIDRSFDGEDLNGAGRLLLARGAGPPPKTGVRARVGLRHVDAAHYPWRFVEEGSPYLSKP